MSEPLSGEIVPYAGGAGAGAGGGGGGVRFRADAFGEPWQVFSSYDMEIRGVASQAGQEIADVVAEGAGNGWEYGNKGGGPGGLTFEELKDLLKGVLPRKMVPYVDLSDHTARAFYEEYRTAALKGATVPSSKVPGNMPIIDQDGNIVSSSAPVGTASADDIYGYSVDTKKVGKSVVPAKSWESAVGGAFKNAEDVAAREGKWEALNRITSKLIGYGDRRMENVYRDVIEQAASGDPYSVGWQRIAYGGACAFCRMLAGRGAVYKTNASASFVVGRGVVRKVRGRPHKRGRKTRAWERPDAREIRALHTTYHDHCQCKVIPRFTFNGAEMPLPPLLQFMQDKYQAEYYTAREALTNPVGKRGRKPIKLEWEDIPKSWTDVKDDLKGLQKYSGKRLDQYVWGVGRKPTVYDIPTLFMGDKGKSRLRKLGFNAWEYKPRSVPRARKAIKNPSGREILRGMRKNNMSARQRRFMPTQPHDYMVDEIASAWPGSPYMKPRPMRLEDFAKDYAGQAFTGLKTEGGILVRRKGNQFVGRVVNKQATRTQRRIERKIDQVEWLPTWGKAGAKTVVAEGRRKSTRAIRYNAKQGLKFATGQQPTWNVEGLFRRELDETVRFHVGLTRRRMNREVDGLTDEVFRAIKTPINQATSPVYDLLDEADNKLGWWGGIFIDPVKSNLKSRERRLIRRLNRPFKRRATRFKRSYGKGGSVSRAVKSRTGRS